MKNERNGLGFGIMELLSANPGRRYSMNQIAKVLPEHYASVYKALHAMDGREIRLVGVGKSMCPVLAFSYENSKALELHETKKFIMLNGAIKERLERIELEFAHPLVNSMSLVNAGKNKGLNYFEVMIILNDGSPAFASQPDADFDGEEQKAKHQKEGPIRELSGKMFNKITKVEKTCNMALNALLLKQSEFNAGLFSPENNTVRECFLEKVVFHKPGIFWQEPFLLRGAPPEITETRKPSGSQLLYALDKYGAGMSSNKKPERADLSVEQLVAELSCSNNPRFIEAVPVLLAKNKVNFHDVLFLARRKNRVNQLGYLLDITFNCLRESGTRLPQDAQDEWSEALHLFKLFKSSALQPLTSGVAETPKDQTAKDWGVSTRNTADDFGKVMRLYGAA